LLRQSLKKSAIALLTLALSAGVASAETVLTYSSWLPWTHPVNIAIYIPWMDAIEAETNGRIKFKRLPKAVASPPAHLDAIRTGQADVGFTVHGYGRKRFAAYLFAELPFLGDSALATSVALQKTHEKFLADKDYYAGTKLIGMNMHGPGVIHHSTKNIMVPEDMKGQKMRTGGPIALAIVEAWGGVSIRQPAPKSYEILSSGIADGILFPFESLPSFKITDIVKYSTVMPGGWYSSSHYFMMNESKYNALPDEDKAVVDKYSGVAFAELAGNGWDQINGAGKEAVIAAGNSIKTAPDATVKALEELNEGFLETYYESAAAAGVDGKAMYDYFRAEVANMSK
jgi:TRAP-type C4-dicarboxylate transport system substrate-binding protein